MHAEIRAMPQRHHGRNLLGPHSSRGQAAVQPVGAIVFGDAQFPDEIVEVAWITPTTWL